MKRRQVLIDQSPRPMPVGDDALADAQPGSATDLWIDGEALLLGKQGLAEFTLIRAVAHDLR